MTTARDLSKLIDQELGQMLSNLDLVDWDEDHISFMLVNTLRHTLRKAQKITVPHSYFYSEGDFFLDIEAYKATGALERRHGDIAIVIQYMDLNRIGTGFYEAKAEGPRGDYPAFNMRQLRRLTTSTPQLALLLYERTEKAVSDDEYSFNQLYERSSLRSRLRVIGANIARKYPRPELVPDFPCSFGHHFVSRYLTGRDLDYSRDPHLAIQKWIKATRRASPVVVNIRISKTPLAFSEPVRVPIQEAEVVPLIRLMGLGEGHLNRCSIERD